MVCGRRFLGTRLWVLLVVLATLVVLSSGMQAQETTGGLQGTVKDANGAVVPKATVELTGNNQAGNKTQQTDNSGYYRFANLPPGTYAVTVTAPGFASVKREGIHLEVGRLPSLDLTLKVGSESTVVEVTAEAPLIDVTTNSNNTNISPEVVNNIPHGYSFQSVIQFAPAARNEPLAGATSTTSGGTLGGNGGSLPGSSGNGQQFGYSVAGGADSENSYLIEGQDTENISGGYSNANVPFQFIQEVQVKSSGVEAEHGGALGGVVNVIMKKGSNAWHGELFASYESSALDTPSPTFLRYDPTSGPVGRTDQGSNQFSPKKDTFRILNPGVTIGGPIMRDRLWFFAGFAPQYNSRARTIDYSTSSNPALAVAGPQTFNQDEQQYFSNVRLDATVTQKIRVFGSWLYQYARESGANLPHPDPQHPGLLNTSTNVPITAFGHGLGFSAPNATFNTGADITITPRLVSTTRYGYFFQNYHDFGWPTTGVNLDWNNAGLTSSGPATDSTGAPVPAGLQQPGGTQTAFAYKPQYTRLNAGKHFQFDQDIAYFKSGWWGTHNFKFGYQYNHLALSVNQNGNVPQVFVNPYSTSKPGYSALTTFGLTNCATLTAAFGQCGGQYGWLNIQDFATVGTSTDTNHGLFFQDSWTIGKGITINAGLRIEKETLPPPPLAGSPGLLAGHTINFPWSKKIAPRLGAAWDVFRDGKMKVFGSYGVTNDVMKLLLAETSWGGQVFEQCEYALSPNGAGGFDPAAINPVFVNGRACPSGLPSTGANFAGGVTPAGMTLIENTNERPFEPVAPGVNPYRQHESVFGIDYALSKNWAFEARWDRRRLDHILEDASLTDVNNNEIYTIVNPGEGVNKTINGYAAFLGSLGPVFEAGIPTYFFNSALFGTCTGCPNNIKAARSYDGIELRLTKANSRHYAGMFSYTYSKLRGNYTGLTSTEETDGAEPGRNSPDTSRAFDEPYFYFNSFGKSSSGPLPTDRPNTFKGYVYYTLSEGKRNTTTFGLFQTAYQGAPVSSFIDVGATFFQPGYAVYPFNRGKYVNATTDALGNITLGTPYTRRTPWFIQSDLNVAHDIKVDKNNERRVFGAAFDATNLFNQRKVTAISGSINSWQLGTFLTPGIALTGSGAAAYQVYETGYSVQGFINSPDSPVTLSSWYGQPFRRQLGRTMRVSIHYSF